VTVIGVIKRLIGRRLSLMFVLLLMPAAVGADSWPGPVTLTRFSDDGRFFVRITPGSSVGDTYGFAGEPKGPYASAQFYALQADGSYRLVKRTSLLNPIAPVDAIVTKRGYLVTFDNWHNLGFGKVLAVYGPSGDPIASYTLEQLYSADQLRRIRQSVSSRYWRCAPFHFVDPAEQTQLYVREALGGDFVLTIATGTIAYHANHIPNCVAPELPRR